MFVIVSILFFIGQCVLAEDVSINKGDLVKLLEELILNLNKENDNEVVVIKNNTLVSDDKSVDIDIGELAGKVPTTPTTTTTTTTETTTTTTPTTTTIPWKPWDPSESPFQYRCRKRDNPNTPDFCQAYCSDPDHLVVPIRMLYQLMHNCAISCALCGPKAICKDRDPGCGSYRMLCNREYYSQDIQRIYCGKTCGYCD